MKNTGEKTPSRALMLPRMNLRLFLTSILIFIGFYFLKIRYLNQSRRELFMKNMATITGSLLELNATNDVRVSAKVDKMTTSIPIKILCPEITKNKQLQGTLNEALMHLYDNLTEMDVIKKFPNVQSGGHWTPTHCIPRFKIAIIVPYRDRQLFLNHLINYLIPMLIRQSLDFRFIISEQVGNGPFNRGLLLNVGFTLADKHNVDCVIFHDVDMVPQNDRIPYGCPQTLLHLGAYVNTLKYKPWNAYLVGGVLAIRMNIYKAVNGHSNLYKGWGKEDNDLGLRLLSLNFTINRPPRNFARFTMLKHYKEKGPRKNFHLSMKAVERMKIDGLNDTKKWHIVQVIRYPLYYRIHVNPIR